jgi:acyl-CoA thioester hydrolase
VPDASPYLHRVLYGDTDQMQVVYYASYLRFFEGARNEWIRNHGMTYAEIEASGVLLPVVEAAARYYRPARYDDLLEIRTDVSASRVRIRFDYEVRRHGEEPLLIAGHTVHASVNREGRPVRMPQWLHDKLGPHVGKGLRGDRSFAPG